MEKYCVSLEIAKKLKEAGWKKETEFWWHETMKVELVDKVWYKGVKEDVGGRFFPAPITDEILEELPYEIKIQDRFYWLCIEKEPDHYIVFYKDENKDISEFREDKSLPNALAKMWLYLKSNNLLEGR